MVGSTCLNHWATMTPLNCSESNSNVLNTDVPLSKNLWRPKCFESLTFSACKPVCFYHFLQIWSCPYKLYTCHNQEIGKPKIRKCISDCILLTGVYFSTLGFEHQSNSPHRRHSAAVWSLRSLYRLSLSDQRRRYQRSGRPAWLLWL